MSRAGDEELVGAKAPRLFAVVAEIGEIAGWGMAFDDHALVACDGGRSFLAVSSPDRACWLLSPANDARLVWVDAR